MSITAVLLEEETAALNRAAAGDQNTKVPARLTPPLSPRLLFPEQWSTAVEAGEPLSKTRASGAPSPVSPLSPAVSSFPSLRTLHG